MYALVFIVILLALVLCVGWLLATVKRLSKDLEQVKKDLFVMSRVVRDVSNGVVSGAGSTVVYDDTYGTDTESVKSDSAALMDLLVKHGFTADHLPVDED